jgi:hypothetical protein
MVDFFKEFNQAAQKQGAGPVVDYVKERAMKGAAGLAAMGAAAALGPENIEDIRQTGRDIDDRFGPDIRLMRDQGMSVSAQPNYLDPMATTVTPSLDLSAISPYLQGQAQATMGQGGLLGYNIDAQVPMGDFTGTLNYGPQGGTMGVNYAQDGLSAYVNAPVPERTAGVKGLLDNLQFRLQYRRNF